MLKEALAIIDSQNSITREEAMQIIEALKNKCYLSAMETNNVEKAAELNDISWKLGNI